MTERAIELVLIFTSILLIVDPFAVIPTFLAMTVRDSPAQRKVLARRGAWTCAITLILFAAGVALFGDFVWVPAAATAVDQDATNGTIQAVAEPLFTDWVLAFEATALLLTIAAAGAVVLAQFKRKRA